MIDAKKIIEKNGIEIMFFNSKSVLNLFTISWELGEKKAINAANNINKFDTENISLLNET